MFSFNLRAIDCFHKIVILDIYFKLTIPTEINSHKIMKHVYYILLKCIKYVYYFRNTMF